jgi:hypothetical protein
VRPEEIDDVLADHAHDIASAWRTRFHNHVAGQQAFELGGIDVRFRRHQVQAAFRDPESIKRDEGCSRNA